MLKKKDCGEAEVLLRELADIDDALKKIGRICYGALLSVLTYGTISPADSVELRLEPRIAKAALQEQRVQVINDLRKLGIEIK